MNSKRNISYISSVLNPKHVKYPSDTNNEESKVNHPKHYNEGIETWDYVYSHRLDFF